MESRLIGQEAAFLGSQVQGGQALADRARRVVPGSRTRRRARCTLTTHSGPLAGAYGARFAVRACSPRCELAGCTTPVYPPVIPTLVYPPGPYTLPAPHDSHLTTALPVHRGHAHMAVSETL